MDNAYSFFQFLHKFIDLKEDEFEHLILPFLRERNFRKRQVVSKEGEVEEFLNFLVRGMARKYFVKDRQEVNTQIATEGHIIHAQESFHSRKPSEYWVEAIENTTLISISYEDLERIFASGAKMERLGRLVVTFTMIINERRQLNMIRLSPRERFLDFVKKNPDLLQRVPQKFLASYLNIQPETFSRFKHMLRERKV
jgi:CRP-like cAMP-binding protein